MTKRKRTSLHTPFQSERPFTIPSSLYRLSDLSRQLADESDRVVGIDHSSQNMRLIEQAQAWSASPPPFHQGAATSPTTVSFDRHAQSYEMPHISKTRNTSQRPPSPSTAALNSFLAPTNTGEVARNGVPAQAEKTPPGSQSSVPPVRTTSLQAQCGGVSTSQQRMSHRNGVIPNAPNLQAVETSRSTVQTLDATIQNLMPPSSPPLPPPPPPPPAAARTQNLASLSPMTTAELPQEARDHNLEPTLEPYLPPISMGRPRKNPPLFATRADQIAALVAEKRAFEEQKRNGKARKCQAEQGPSSQEDSDGPQAQLIKDLESATGTVGEQRKHTMEENNRLWSSWSKEVRKGDRIATTPKPMTMEERNRLWVERGGYLPPSSTITFNPNAVPPPPSAPPLANSAPRLTSLSASSPEPSLARPRQSVRLSPAQSPDSFSSSEKSHAGDEDNADDNAESEVDRVGRTPIASIKPLPQSQPNPEPIRPSARPIHPDRPSITPNFYLTQISPQLQTYPPTPTPNPKGQSPHSNKTLPLYHRVHPSQLPPSPSAQTLLDSHSNHLNALFAAAYRSIPNTTHSFPHSPAPPPPRITPFRAGSATYSKPQPSPADPAFGTQSTYSPSSMQAPYAVVSALPQYDLTSPSTTVSVGEKDRADSGTGAAAGATSAPVEAETTAVSVNSTELSPAGQRRGSRPRKWKVATQSRMGLTGGKTGLGQGKGAWETEFIRF